MSRAPQSTPSPTDFQTIFKEAMEIYQKKTKKDLTSHRLTSKLQSCSGPDAIIDMLRNMLGAQSTDEKLTKWLDPTVNVLCAFSDTIGSAAGLAFPPATIIFSGIGILLQAVKDVRASRQALVDLFGLIESFFNRLTVYTNITLPPAMTEVIVKILAEVLSILGMATKEIREGPIKKYFKKLVGWKGAPVADAVQRLDSLIRLVEIPMAIAETFRITHKTDGKVDVVQKRLEGVGQRIETVDRNVQGIDDKMQSVKDELHGVDDKVDSVIESGEDTMVAIQQMETQVGNMNRSESLKNLRRWISHSDPSDKYNKTCEAQYEGTAAWCTKGKAFADWKVEGPLLWIHGKPGSGKTFLSSAIIREIRTLSDSRKAHIAYFYFDAHDTDKEKEDPLERFRALLSSLLFQLSDQSDQFSVLLRELYSKRRNDIEKPLIRLLVQCLKAMLSITGQPPTYLVLDALDECPDSVMPSSRDKVLGLVEELVQLRLPNLRLCVTSRPEYDIRSVLEPMATQNISLHDEPEQRKDIETYVNTVVRSIASMKRWTDEDQVMVIKNLVETADGMFQWVFCQLEVLQRCPRPDLRRTLAKLPERLDQTYGRILKSISDTNREPARQFLQCLTVAARPLRDEELAEFFAIDFNAGGTSTRWLWEDQKDAVLSACSSLVSVGVDQVVRFWHFSMKDYLTSNRLANSPDKDLSYFHTSLETVHATLAHACLKVLLRLDDNTEKDAYPLLPYAAECWIKHAQFKDVELRTDVQDAMDTFFDSANPHFSAWIRIQRLHDLLDVPADSETPAIPSAGPVYLAAYYGFRGLVERMIAKHPEHVSAYSGAYGTPLHSSILAGYTSIAELLLAHGAKVNAPGTYSATPLYIAVRHGRLDAAKWLLDHAGADVNAQRADGQTALHPAALNGHLDAVRMLLDHKADVGARDVEGSTPLSLALEGAGGERRLDIVRLLLDHNADVDTRDYSGRTPLHHAAAYGYLEVSELLLQRKAKCSAQDAEGSTPLHRASDAAELRLMQLLLDHGADANARDNIGNTPLHQAALNTLVDVARMLLEYNAEVNARNNCGSTPLHLASEEGELDFVSLLLDYGADVQARDNCGNTPLQIASANGHHGIVRILLDHDVEIDTQSDYTSTPSHFTSEEGDYDAVCASLDRFAEAQVRDNGGKTLSEVAGYWGQQGIVHLPSTERMCKRRGSGMASMVQLGQFA